MQSLAGCKIARFENNNFLLTISSAHHYLCNWLIIFIYTNVIIICNISNPVMIACCNFCSSIFCFAFFCHHLTLLRSFCLHLTLLCFLLAADSFEQFAFANSLTINSPSAASYNFNLFHCAGQFLVQVNFFEIHINMTLLWNNRKVNSFDHSGPVLNRDF